MSVFKDQLQWWVDYDSPVDCSLFTQLQSGALSLVLIG